MEIPLAEGAERPLDFSSGKYNIFVDELSDDEGKGADGTA